MLMRCPRGTAAREERKPEHIFLLLGLVGAVAGTLVSVLGGGDELWQVVGAVMIGFASALVAVAAVTYLWSWLGGDPLKVAMDEVAGATESLDSSVDRLSAGVDPLKVAMDEVAGATESLDSSVNRLSAGVEEVMDATGALRESVKILDDTYRTGLRRFHPRASEFGSPSRWAGLLDSAEEEIDLMGWTLAGWWATDLTGQTLRKALASGVDVRVLVVDPENPFIDKPSGEDKSPDLVRKELENSIARFKTIGTTAVDDGLPGTLDLRRVKDDLILWHICRTDDRAVCMPYLRSVLPSESPVLEIERTRDGFLLGLEAEFNFLHKRAVK